MTPRSKKPFHALKKTVLSKNVSIRQRRTACWALGLSTEPQVVDLFLRILSKETDVVLIWEAGKGLANQRGKGAIVPLKKILRNSASPLRREVATYALGFLEAKSAVPILIRTLANGNEVPAVRGQAAEALAYIGKRQAVKPLLTALKDPSVKVRFWAIFALGHLGTKRVLPALRWIAKNDKEVLPGWWSIRKEAQDTIKKLTGRSTRQKFVLT